MSGLLAPAGAGLRPALGAALAFVLLLALAVPAETWVARGTARVGPAALLGLWAPMIGAQATARGVAPDLALALIAQESGGDYLAVHVDPNGSVDAGLGQVNQIHWAQFGLTADPFDPRRNVAASLDLLRAAMDRHPRDLAAALEAYNGFGPGYARAVLAAAAAIASRPALSVWPVSGREHAGVWSVPTPAGRSSAFVLITAYDAAGPVLAAPERLSATCDGRPVAIAPAGAAPAALERLTPPQAAFWWVAVPLPARGGPARVTVTALWRATRDGTRTGPPARATLVRIRTVQLVPEG